MRGRTRTHDSTTEISNYKRRGIACYWNGYFHSARHQQRVERYSDRRVFVTYGSAPRQPESFVSEWEYWYNRAAPAVSLFGIAIVTNTYIQHLMR